MIAVWNLNSKIASDLQPVLCFFYMETMIRIPKTEYHQLTKIAKNYELLRRVFSLNFFEKPAVRSRKQIMNELKSSDHYNRPVA
jgi:hypothetical protein